MIKESGCHSGISFNLKDCKYCKKRVTSLAHCLSMFILVIPIKIFRKQVDFVTLVSAGLRDLALWVLVFCSRSWVLLDSCLQ